MDLSSLKQNKMHSISINLIMECPYQIMFISIFNFLYQETSNSTGQLMVLQKLHKLTRLSQQHKFKSMSVTYH